jgi:hypothetical protein
MKFNHYLPTWTALRLSILVLACGTSFNSHVQAGQLAWRKTDGELLRVVPNTPRPGYSVERLVAGGRRDLTFGREGRAEVELGPDRLRPSSIALDVRGRILIVGNTETPSGEGWSLLRLQANGQPDPSLSGTGRSVHTIGSNEAGVFDVIELDSGALLLAGSLKTGSGEQAVLSRWRADGGLDTQYGEQGWSLLSDTPAGSRGVALHRQANGAVVLGVVIESEDRTELLQVSLDANGVPVVSKRPGERRKINGAVELGDVSLTSSGPGSGIIWQFNPKQDGSLPRMLDVSGTLVTDAAFNPLGAASAQPGLNIVSDPGAAAAQPFSDSQLSKSPAVPVTGSQGLADSETTTWLGMFLMLLVLTAMLFWFLARPRRR